MVCNIDNKQKINQEFEVNGIKCQFDGILLHDMAVSPRNMTSLSVN